MVIGTLSKFVLPHKILGIKNKPDENNIISLGIINESELTQGVIATVIAIENKHTRPNVSNFDLFMFLPEFPYVNCNRLL